MSIVYKETLYSRTPSAHPKPSKKTPAKTGKFELYKDKAGEYRFRLKASNGAVIATSEGYRTKKACMNGIESVIRNAANGKIVWL